MIIKDLGAVSAYAYAVEKGYTGTEEEFAELMASYATVAEEAADSAESASQSAESASASAQTATTKASEASTSATQAGASATSASQSASTATAKASEASASASTASTKASEASASATTASTKASEASASATSAQTAQGLAESARDDAIDAKTDAETARDLAQQYAESINPENIFSAYPTDTGSGAVATFPDGADDIPMKSVKVAIEPVQDLHGYDNPWPAGGGKNLLEVSETNLEKPSYISGTWTGTTVASGENAVTVTRGTGTGGFGGVVIPTGLKAGTYTFSCDVATTTSVKTFYYGGTQNGVSIGQQTLGSVSGSAEKCTQTFTLENDLDSFYIKMSGNNADMPITFSRLQIELGSTATDYAPYSNICPITSFAGENIWDEEWEVGSINNGEPVSSLVAIRSKNFCPIVGGRSYYATCSRYDGGSQNGYYLAVAFYDANKTYINRLWANNNKFTAPINACYFKIYTNTSVVVYGGTYNNDIAIKYPATLTGYVPYSGKGGATVHVVRAGKNLFDEKTFVSGVYNSVNFGISSSADIRSAKLYLKEGTYTLSATASSSTINRRIMDGTMSSANRNLPMTFTLSADGWFGFSTVDLTSDFQIELGSTATAYEPCTSNTYPITFPSEAGTVYGGVLDVTNGVLTVDRAMVDLGALTWGTYTTEYKAFISNFLTDMTSAKTAVVYCDRYKQVFAWINADEWANNDKIITVYNNSDNRIRIKDTNYTDLNTFRTAMNGVQLCYELATPITYHLTPTEIKSLLGENTVWSDAGNIEVTYRADTAMYIDKKIAEVINALS